MAWFKLPTRDYAGNLEKAINACHAALEVFTSESHPFAWAAVQNGLGIARANLPTGRRGDNILKAINAYNSALSVYKREAHLSNGR